jgi:hypothetical protein
VWEGEICCTCRVVSWSFLVPVDVWSLPLSKVLLPLFHSVSCQEWKRAREIRQTPRPPFLSLDLSAVVQVPASLSASGYTTRELLLPSEFILLHACVIRATAIARCRNHTHHQSLSDASLLCFPSPETCHVVDSRSARLPILSRRPCRLSRMHLFKLAAEIVSWYLPGPFACVDLFTCMKSICDVWWVVKHSMY